MTLVDRIVAPYFATNCWVLASGVGQECVIVDPGIGQPNLVREIRGLVDSHHLKVSAILVTHGHLDHSFSILPLQRDVNGGVVYVHKSDRDLLTDPTLALGPAGMQMLQELSKRFGTSFEEPNDVQELASDQVLEVAGISLRIIHTPGHTPGSIVAVVNDEYLVSGDTLFAGAIGRTDLPRGSASDMERSLREKISRLPGELQVLPGHGPTTTLEREMRTNPFLISAMSTQS